MKRNYPDFITQHVEMHAPLEVPPIFNKWAAVSVIGAALNRRVWLNEDFFRYYPNFYLVFVGPPSAKKSQALKSVVQYLRKVPAMHIGASYITSAKLIQDMAECCISDLVAPYDPSALTQRQMPMSCMSCYASELDSFLDLSDPFLSTVLIDLYDCPERLEKGTKTQGEDEVINAFFNFAGCTTLSWMTTNFSRNSWETGLASRMIFIYQDRNPKRSAHPGRNKTFNRDRYKAEVAKMTEDLTVIRRLAGEYTMTDDAYEYSTAWYDTLMDRIETTYNATMLNGYLARQHVFFNKLAIVIHASRSNDAVITLDDLHVVDGLLKEQEATLTPILKTAVPGAGVYASEQIKEQLRRHGPQTQTNLFRSMMHIMSRPEFVEGLTTLADAGLATMVDGKIRLTTPTLTSVKENAQ